jgi:hypothetical protein
MTTRLKRSANDVVLAIRSRGSDAHDLRDAAHEATHAMQSRIRGPWERERLHAALERVTLRGNSNAGFIRSMIRHELQARAVEMLACQQYGIPYEPEKWAMWCAMETVKTYRIDVGSIADLVDAIRTVAKQSETLDLLDRVLSVPLARSSRARQEAA